MQHKTNTLLVKTPEGIVFSQWLAGPITRFLAWLLDLFCISVLMIALGFLLGWFKLVSADFAGALSVLGYFVISIGYGIFFEWHWRGQTLGKKLFRLRVVDAQGLRLQFHQIVLRNLLRFVDALPALYFLGGAACWFNRKSQRLGDLAANTLVIRNPAISEPDLDQLLAGQYNSLRQHPRLEARLRQRVAPAEAGLALQALLRRDEFDLHTRVELFAELAAHFRAKVPFPAEALEGISDEQYLRNLVDVLFRSRTEAKFANGNVMAGRETLPPGGVPRPRPSSSSSNRLSKVEHEDEGRGRGRLGDNTHQNISPPL